MANLTVSFKFTPDSPWLPWQRNLGQMDYNLVSARDICEIYTGGRRLGVVPSNAANKFLPDRHFLPWQRHLRQKGYN